MWTMRGILRYYEASIARAFPTRLVMLLFDEVYGRELLRVKGPGDNKVTGEGQVSFINEALLFHMPHLCVISRSNLS